MLEQIEFRANTNDEDGPLEGNTINVYLTESTPEAFDEDGFLNLDLQSTDITFGGQMELIGFSEFTFPPADDPDFAQDNLFQTALEDFETGGTSIPLLSLIHI